MTISTKGLYALQAIFDLASRKTTEPVRIADIARRQRIPQKFLELILAALKQSGLVDSRRGAEGGYLLARPASAITVGEVLRVIEGTGGVKVRGKRKADNPFSDLWRQVDEAVSAIVDRTTFADLVRAWEDRQTRYVPYWEI